MSIQKREWKGGTTYRVRVYHKRKVVADNTFDRHRDAVAFETKVKAKLQTGDYVDRALADNMILSAALDKYVKTVSPTLKGGHTDASRANGINKYPIARLPLSKIKSADIARFRDQRLEDVGANSVRLAMALISQTIEQARQEWDMPYLVNPVNGVRRPSLSGTQRDRRLLAGEYALLIKTAMQYDNSMRDVIPFAIETAMRQGEIASITPEIVNLKSHIIVLPETKNGTARTIPLSSTAYEIVARRMDTCSAGMPVFAYHDAHSISTAFRKITKKANIVDLHFHDLRHEATSRLFEKGLSTEQVKSITGHKTYAMLARYTHLKASDLVDLLG